MTKKELTKAEYMRLYMRCRTRGMNVANLRGHDLKVFVNECMESEKKASRQSKLTKSERLQRATKLITKFKRREHKPKKHKILYINVTPSKSDPILTDFFIDPNKIQDPKKELRQFMKRGKVDYGEIMRKIKEIEQK